MGKKLLHIYHAWKLFMKTIREWRYRSTFLYLSTRWMWVVTLPLRPLYPRGGAYGTKLCRRTGGPQGRSGRFGQEGKPCCPPTIETLLPGHAARSLTTVLTALLRHILGIVVIIIMILAIIIILVTLFLLFIILHFAAFSKYSFTPIFLMWKTYTKIKYASICFAKKLRLT